MDKMTTPYHPPRSELDVPASSSPAYFKGWLIFFLVCTLGGAVAGGAFGALAAVAIKLLGQSPSLIPAASGAAGFVISIPVSYFSFRWSVSRYIVNATR